MSISASDPVLPNARLEIPSARHQRIARPKGNDLSLGYFIWGDGSVKAIKKTIFHNMEVVPGRDGDLTPGDVGAVAAYLWALGRSHNR
ncbi:MAG: hypothetical protein ACLPJY_01015 [Rhodomicrobium sp.]